MTTCWLPNGCAYVEWIGFDVLQLDDGTAVTLESLWRSRREPRLYSRAWWRRLWREMRDEFRGATA